MPIPSLHTACRSSTPNALPIPSHLAPFPPLPTACPSNPFTPHDPFTRSHPSMPHALPIPAHCMPAPIPSHSMPFQSLHLECPSHPFTPHALTHPFTPNCPFTPNALPIPSHGGLHLNFRLLSSAEPRHTVCVYCAHSHVCLDCEVATEKTDFATTSDMCEPGLGCRWLPRGP